MQPHPTVHMYCSCPHAQSPSLPLSLSPSSILSLVLQYHTPGGTGDQRKERLKDQRKSNCGGGTNAQVAQRKINGGRTNEQEKCYQGKIRQLEIIRLSSTAAARTTYPTAVSDYDFLGHVSHGPDPLTFTATVRTTTQACDFFF